MNNRIGKLLVAHPHFPLNSPFAKSVIYIYQDDPVNGTVGVVINKPSRTSVSDIASQNNVIFGESKELVYMGGPVNKSSLLLLHTNDWHSANTAAAGARLRISSDNHMLMKLSHDTNQPAYWRLFIGLSSWMPGQLDAEIQGNPPFGPIGSWLTCEADESIMFNCAGDKQWHKAVELCSQQTIDQYF